MRSEEEVSYSDDEEVMQEKTMTTPAVATPNARKRSVSPNAASNAAKQRFQAARQCNDPQVHQADVGRLLGTSFETHAEETMQKCRQEIMEDVKGRLVGFVDKLMPKSVFVDHFTKIKQRCLEQAGTKVILKVNDSLEEQLRSRLRQFEDAQTAMEDQEIFNRLDAHDELVRKCKELQAQSEKAGTIQKQLETKVKEGQDAQQKKNSEIEELRKSLQKIMQDAKSTKTSNEEVDALKKENASLQSKLQEFRKYVNQLQAL